MKTPTLSLIIPTAGRASLRRTLESAAPQILPGDECIVVGDTLDGPLPQTEAICRDFPWVRYIEHAAAKHCWGHAQYDYALDHCTGDYIFGNDDDDCWTGGAFAAVREAAQAFPGRLLLFRFQSQIGGGFVFWHTPGMQWVRQGHIGGHSLVMPNLPGKVGRRTSTHYEADFDQIIDAIRRHAPVDPVFCDYVIAEQRPKAEEIAA